MHTLKALLSASLLALVGAAATQAAENVTISLAHANHPEVYQAVANEFMKQNPDIQIKLQPAANDYDQLLQTLLRGNITHELPDVAFQSVNRIDVLTDNKMAQPIDKFLPGEADLEGQGYSSSLVDTCRFNGLTYCLPFAISIPIIYYNPELVKQAGGDPEHFPTNWEGIIDLAKKIDALSDKTLGIYFSYYNHSSNWTTTALITSLGGKLLSADGKSITFDSPAGMEMLQLMHRFGEAGQLDISLDQARQAFAAGTLGILSTSSSHLAKLEQQAASQFKLETAPWPMSENGRLPAGGNGIFMFTKDPVKQVAAWKFIKFATGPVGQTIMVKDTGYTPVNTIALNEPELLGDYYKQNPNQRTAASEVRFITRWDAFAGANGLKASNVFRDYVQSVVSLKRTPEEVMPKMVRDIAKLMPN
ncbi:ABC transporter substrate-binding protein [Mesorhizobium sp. B4-1-4]|uniref:ABC transporter substrate-binding protein n=1 Tax=Mesorhizobium sp. B4-1-4 TaxID=2589888 RepID=UPI001129AA63|nr:ABC transporter substrate-binding protein [Mesorhizobium sp. B4-1-4]UCI31763.1 ABC transporter substrate-binding protein [Mesorhizobium sp. B4-1-4]